MRYILTLLLVFAISGIANSQSAGLYVAPGTVLSSSGVLTVEGDVINEGSIEIASGSSINFNGDRWKNTPSSTIDGDGIVNFVGNASNTAQILDGGGSTASFPSLAISSQYDLKLVNTNTYVRDTVFFETDNGLIVLDTMDLVLGDGAPGIIENYSELRYFMTNYTGLFYRVNVGVAAQDFPIGMAANDYTPLEISNTSGSSNTGVRVTDYANSPAAVDYSNEGIDRVWNVVSTATSGTVILQHNDATEGSAYTNSDAYVTRYIGTNPNSEGGANSFSNWDNTGTGLVGTASGTITTGTAIGTASELPRSISTDFDTYQWYTKSVNDNSPLTETVQLLVKALLEGPFDAVSGLMNDDLRYHTISGIGFVPKTEPYSGIAAFNHVGGGGETILDSISVYGTTGANAIVDWVFIELRDKTDNTTVLATKAALIQRDGDIVEYDGNSPLQFTGLSDNTYYVAVRHRNHFGVMTAATVTIPNATKIDFTDGSVTEFNYGTSLGGGFDYTGLSQYAVGGKRVMWTGNANSDNIIKYQSPNDDIATIFQECVFNPNNLTNNYNFNTGYGYFQGDVNMDGKVKLQAPGDDATVIFTKVSFYPLNPTSNLNFGSFIEQLP